MKLKPDVKALWLAALRSGEYQQGRESLQSIDGFCCLGVLCDVYDKEAGDTNGWFDAGCSGDRAFGDEDAVAYPPAIVYEWAFQNIHDDCSENCVRFGHSVFEGFESASTLVGCNDDLRLSFNQIANVIEEQL